MKSFSVGLDKQCFGGRQRKESECNSLFDNVIQVKHLFTPKMNTRVLTFNENACEIVLIRYEYSQRIGSPEKALDRVKYPIIGNIL